MSLIIVGFPCRICGRDISASVDHLTGGDDLRGHLCERCYVDEQNAYDTLLTYLADHPTEMAHCGQCNKPLNVIEQETGSRKLYMHIEIGNVSLLCRVCSDRVTARMNSKTVAGRYSHLSKEEMRDLMLREHRERLRKGRLTLVGKP